MKKIIFIAFLALFAYSCNTSEYDLENLIPENYKRVVSIKGAGTEAWKLFDVGIPLSTNITVLRSGGIPDLSASTKLVPISQEELTLFNESYIAVDPSFYTVPSSIDFAAGERFKQIPLSVPYEKIQEIKELEKTLEKGKVFCIAVKLETDGITSIDKDAYYVLRKVTVEDPKIDFGLESGELWRRGDSMNIEVSLPFENKEFTVAWNVEFESDSFLALNQLGESQQMGNSLPAKYHVHPLPLSSIRNAEVKSIAPGSQKAVYTIKLPEDAAYGNYYFKVKLSNPTLNGNPIGSLSGDVDATVRFEYMPQVNLTTAPGAYTALDGMATVVPPTSMIFVPESSHKNSVPEAIDNNPGSFWENNWGAGGSYGVRTIPFNAAVDLGAPTQVDLLEIWRRSGYYVTDLRRFEVYAAETMDYSNRTSIAYGGLTYLGAVDFGGTSNKNVAQLFAMDSFKTQYLLLRFTGSNRGACISIAEMGCWHR